MKKYIWLLMVAIAFFIGWHLTVPTAVLQYEGRKAAESIVKTMPDFSGTVAVLCFSNEEISEEEKDKAVDAMEKAIIKRFKNIKIVERRNLSEILREQKFSLSPLSENSETIKIGKLARATHLFILNLSSWKYEEKKAKLNGSARLVDVETGTVLWVQPFSKEHYPIFLRVLGWILILSFVFILLSWLLKYERKVKTGEVLKETKERVIDAEEILKSLLRKVEELRNLTTKKGEIEKAKNIRKEEERISQLLNRVQSLPRGSINWTAYENAKGAKNQADKFENALLQLNQLLKEMQSEKIDKESLWKEVESNISALESTLEEYFLFIR